MASETELWGKVKVRFEAQWTARAHELRKDFTKKKLTADYREAIDAWLARLDAARVVYSASAPPKTLDVDVEAAAAAVDHHPDDYYAWWAAKMGGAFLVRAHARTWGIDWYGVERYNYVTDSDQHSEFPIARSRVNELRAFRAAVNANATTLRDARAEAASIRARAPLALRCVTDFAFFDETAWADEDCAAMVAGKEPHFGYLFESSTDFASCLLATRASPESRDAIAKLLAKWGERVVSYGTNQFLDEIVAVHGVDAVPQIAALLPKATGDKRTEFANALASIPKSIDVARALAQGLDDKLVRVVAQKYLDDNPAFARTVLEEVVAKRGKVAEAAARLLARGKSESTKRANASELPRVLAAPPWLSGKKKPTLPTVAIPKTLSYRDRVAWKAGAKDEALALDPVMFELLQNWNEIPKKAKRRSREMDEHIAKKIKRAGDGRDFFKRLHYTSEFLDLMSDKAALAAWTTAAPKIWGLQSADLRYALARFDLDALDGWLRAADAFPQKAIETAEVVDSARIASFVADTFAYTKRAAITARKWLVAHAEAAAVALVPLALAPDAKGKKDGRKRGAPCAALRAIDAGGAGDIVRAVAKKYGEDTRIAIDAVLAFDPLDDYPDKLPKLPEFFDAKTLPAPTLKSGGAIDANAVTAIGTMLAFSHPLDPYPGLVIVKDACDAKSLAAFAWALFQDWMLANAPSASDWALMALAHFGGDDEARNLAAKIREWPGEGGHARAVKGLDVLTAIGSDVAIMHLDRIAQKLKFKGLQEKARAKMQEVAEARGLTADELGDRIAPTLDLDDAGSRTLSFGARSFRVGFDADLKPFVRGEDDKRIGDLPKPGKSDDAVIAKASLDVWKALKKDAKTVASSQIFRLERAMCTARTWDVALFRTFFVSHPLVSHLVRRLVWRAGDRTFRVAEDRSFSDARDATLALAGDAVVSLPHRLALSDDDIATWTKIFGDYEILQPFPQLARDTYAMTSEEKRATKIERFAKKKTSTGKVLHLEDRGWRKGFAQDAGWIWDMKKDLGDGVTAALAIGGGILAGDLRESPPDQELGAITLTQKIGTLSPVAFSELVRDVTDLLGA